MYEKYATIVIRERVLGRDCCHRLDDILTAQLLTNYFCSGAYVKSRSGSNNTSLPFACRPMTLKFSTYRYAFEGLMAVQDD